jgi:uncharacterized protein involved in exopolysaccharide biosynthesis
LKRLARRDLPQRVPPRRADGVVLDEAAALWPELSVGAVLGWAVRGLLLVGLLAVVGAVAGYGYAVLAEPKFTASTDMIIDPSNLQVVTDDLYKTPMDQNSQLLDVESKLRVLTSGNVLRRVVEQLQLQDDPEFVADDARGDPVLSAVGALAKKVSAWREERSFVVTVAVSTTDPDKSVRIADAIVAAFQAELARAEADGASRASTSLLERLADMQGGVSAAEQAVERFKRANNLQSSNGELVNSQSMTQLNKSALDAQQALLAAQSHYTELTDPTTGAANADAVQTATMVALRTQFGLLRQQADAAATLYGPLHPNRTSVDRQIKGLQAQIAAEANRAVQSAKLELDQARRTVAGLATQTDAARSTVSTDDAAQVTLNNLEREAKAKSDVYESFLTRAKQVAERQQLDTTNIRIISPATPPSQRSWPPRNVVVAGVGAAAGGALGLVLALGLGWLGETRRLRRKA